MVNTVGCGDAFIVTFASAKIEGHEDIGIRLWRCAAGTYKATRIETRESSTFTQLDNMFKKWAQL